MSIEYKMDFTDGDLNRRFELAPFTTNGPVAPNSATLHGTATDADTTLLLYGKGAPDFGERVQENMIHMLENFASVNEPVFPINGQIWYKRESGMPSQLHVYNYEKYTILTSNNTTNNVSTKITFDAGTPEQAALEIARLVVNAKLTIYNGGVPEKYSISQTSTIISGNTIEVEIVPGASSSLAGAYLGGWEIILQNNGFLGGNWKINPDGGPPYAWTLTNVPDPVSPYDVANMKYVDDEIIAAVESINTIAELADTTIATPANGEILIFNTTSNTWENRPAGDAIVAASGGTMTGDLNMGGNYITNLAYPQNGTDAANKTYVLDQIDQLRTEIPTLLDDLDDCLITTPANGEMLQYSGGQWRNTSAASFIDNNNIVTTTGNTTFVGNVYIPSGEPLASNSVAHKQYVIDTVTNAVGSAADGVINSLDFDNNSKVLTITTTSGLSYNTNLAGASGDTSGMTHTIINPNDPLYPDADPVNVFLERFFYDDILYPNVLLSNIITEMSAFLGAAASPKMRVVLPVTSNTNTLIDLEDSPAGLCHAPLTGGGTGPYIVGKNRLSVYLNGVKLIASQHGFLACGADVNLWQGMETGLTATTSFNISVNGGGATNISVPAANAFRFGNLVDYINSVTTNFSVQIAEDGNLVFYSSTPGAGSSISITDGSPGLFGSISGNAGSTGTVIMDSPALGESNPDVVADYGYKEIGFVGDESGQIQLTSPASIGDVLEIIIEEDLYFRG